MAFTRSWDETAPANTDDVGDGDDALRNLKLDLRERLAEEHQFYADESGHSDVGEHSEGSARCTEDTAANIPSASSAGKLFFATDTETLYVDSGSAWNTAPSRQHRYQRVYNSTGTVTTVNAETGVSGSGTNFDELGSGSGWLFRVSGERWYPVASVTDADTLTLSIAYAGTGGAGQNYELANPSDHPDVLPAYNASVQTITLTDATLGNDLDADSNIIINLKAATANGEALRFEHTTSDPIEHADGTVTAAKLAAASGVVIRKISTYTGDGAATQAVTGVGWQPTEVMTYKQSGTAGSAVIKTSSDPGTYSKKLSDGSWDDDWIRSLDADGFTIGDGGTPDLVNASGETYTYIATKEL